MQLRLKMKRETCKNVVCAVAIMLAVLLSVTVLSGIATNPESYKETIQSIDEKKTMVTAVATAAAVASAALATVPGESTTPIANQIMELSSCLLIVVCALVLEKTLLTAMGFVAFNILLPIAGILAIIYVFTRRKGLLSAAVKLVALGIIIASVVPFTMHISDMMYEANRTMVEKVTVTEEAEPESNEEQSWVGKMLDKVKESVAEAGEKAKQLLNSFIDAIALFIIAYCALPLMIVFVVIWIINAMFKLKMPNVDKAFKMAHKKNMLKEKADSEITELIEA